MDRKTFLQLKPGDKLFYITVDNTVLVHGTEIKYERIKEIYENKEKPYIVNILLSNGVTVELNWNLTVGETPLPDPKPIKTQIQPLNFIVYATTEQECCEYLSMKNSALLSSYCQLQIEYNKLLAEVQNELVKLAGIRTLSGMLKVKKVDEVETEAVYV